MKIGYSYIRFSSRHQADGDSLRRQTEKTEAWCKAEGVTLDRSLILDPDLAVSGLFGVNHKGNPDQYALAGFLAACQNGRVQKDSYLIVENLDRLTREDLPDALTLWLSILRMGVNIATITPPMVYRHDQINMTSIQFAIMELYRGHSESRVKSDRVGQAWGERKKKARETKAPVSKMCPKWLTLTADGYRPIPERVEVVRSVFRWCIDGEGIGRIAGRLNQQGVAPWQERGPKHKHRHKPAIWQKSSVAKLLRNRATLGEYQPGIGSRRTPTGDPITDYYPRIITDDDFNLAQHSRTNRVNRRSDKRGQSANLFTGLLLDHKGTPFVYEGHLSTHGRKQYGYVTLSGDKGYPSLPYHVVETAVLSVVNEIKPAELMASKQTRKQAERLAELVGLVQQAADNITDFENRLYTAPKEKRDTWERLLDRAKADHERYNQEMQEARIAVATPEVEGVRDAQSLSAAIKDDPSKRSKLKAKLASLFPVMRLAVWKHGSEKYAWVQLRFRHSDTVRNLVFGYRAGYGQRRPEETRVLAVYDTAEKWPAFDAVGVEMVQNVVAHRISEDLAHQEPAAAS